MLDSASATVVPQAERPPLAAVALALATPALTRLPPARLSRLLVLMTSSRAEAEAPTPAAAARVERGLALASRIRRQTCLTRGVTRFVLLRRAGLPVELVFGLGALDSTFSGHCWLELDREPYLESQDPRGLFPEVFRIPSR